jgi:hypothetical protein
MVNCQAAQLVARIHDIAAAPKDFSAVDFPGFADSSRQSARGSCAPGNIRRSMPAIESTATPAKK